MKDLFKFAGLKCLGPYGLKCPCCDNGYSKKRKNKRNKNAYSKLRRNKLKCITRKEIKEEI